MKAKRKEPAPMTDDKGPPANALEARCTAASIPMKEVEAAEAVKLWKPQDELRLILHHVMAVMKHSWPFVYRGLYGLAKIVIGLLAVEVINVCLHLILHWLHH
jgi:hypothetical protein